MKKNIIKIMDILLVAAVLVLYQQSALTRADQVAAHDAEAAEAEALAKEYEEEAKAAAGEAEEAAESLYADGTYEGTGSGFGGDIVVSVTISGGEITDLQVTSHDGEDPEYFKTATAIIDSILEAQSADVDTVTGATFSSTGIREATENALEEAEN